MSEGEGGTTTSPSLLRVALSACCPRCGRGRMFTGLITVVERCGHCGLDLRAHDSGDGPAVFIILIVGFLVVGAALIVEVRYQPSYWLHMALWPPLVLGLSLGLLRPLKAAFVAIQYRHRSTAVDDGH